MLHQMFDMVDLFLSPDMLSFLLQMCLLFLFCCTREVLLIRYKNHFILGTFDFGLNLCEFYITFFFFLVRFLSAILSLIFPIVSCRFIDFEIC